MSLHFDVGAANTQGSRDYQEDSYIITDPEGTRRMFSQLPHLLVAVADGVGGAVSGDLASQTVSSHLASYVHEHYKTDSAWVEIMESAAKSANNALAEIKEARPEVSSMATTLVSAFISQDRIKWLSIGDSHLYLIRNNKLKKLNADHSIGALLDEQARQGIISEADANNHPDRNSILSFLDGDNINSIDRGVEGVALLEGDCILLCSDGLDTLSHEKIVQLSKASAQNSATNLISEIEKIAASNQDNATVVVVNIQKSNLTNSQQTPKNPGKRGNSFALIIIAFILGVILAVWFLKGPLVISDEDTELSKDNKNLIGAGLNDAEKGDNTTAENPNVDSSIVQDEKNLDSLLQNTIPDGTESEDGSKADELKPLITDIDDTAPDSLKGQSQDKKGNSNKDETTPVDEESRTDDTGKDESGKKSDSIGKEDTESGVTESQELDNLQLKPDSEIEQKLLPSLDVRVETIA